MITYPVDIENTKWSVYQISTDSVIAENKNWPVANGDEIPDLDDDLVYLKQVSSDPPPHNEATQSAVSRGVPYPDDNELRQEWTVVELSLDDIKENIAEREHKEAREYIGDLQGELMKTRLVVAALIQYPDLSSAPAKVKTLVDGYKAEGAALWKRRDRRKQLEADADAGDPVDLSTGWEG